MKCKIDAIILNKMSCRVNKKRSDIDRCEKLFPPISNVKHVCNKRLRVSILLKRCI